MKEQKQIENTIETLKQQTIDNVVSDLKQQLFNSENKIDFMALDCVIRSAYHLMQLWNEIDVKYHELSQNLKVVQQINLFK